MKLSGGFDARCLRRDGSRPRLLTLFSLLAAFGGLGLLAGAGIMLSTQSADAVAIALLLLAGAALLLLLALLGYRRRRRSRNGDSALNLSPHLLKKRG